jgi:hypothetical protein
VKRTLTTVADPKRPFRLWNANEKKQVRYRYYSDVRRAHVAGMIEARWAKVGVTIEVYDASNGRLHGQYTRTPTSINFQR